MLKRRLLRKALRHRTKLVKLSMKLKNNDNLYPYELWAFQDYIRSIQDITEILTNKLK